MSERDSVVGLLERLDRPVEPGAEFAEALLDRLLAELVPGPPVPPRRSLHLRGRRPLALTVGLAVLTVALLALLLTPAQKASALEVIRQARQAFAAAPSFRATIRLALNPDGSIRDRVVPKGATETVVVSYDGPRRFRAEVVGRRPLLRGGSVPGAYEVFDGHRLALFDPRTNILSTALAPARFRPLEFLRWQGAYPDWEQVCRGPDSKVLPDARLLGRDARHIRCGNFRGDVWELWIDRQTGLLLKIIGPVGGDDVFFGLGVTTSAKGGFEVERLRFSPTFPRKTFSAAAPAGALDYAGRLREALKTVVPFRAVFSARYRRSGTVDFIDEAWWSNDRTWRREVLFDRRGDPRGFRGPGSVSIWAAGRMSKYDAADRTYVRSRTRDPALDPALQLLPASEPGYSPTSCPIVGHARIAGRATVHRHCKVGDVWIDTATGLALGWRFGDFELRVRSIEYHPGFRPSLFRFVPPAGSRDVRQLARDPYYKTRLARGSSAPQWKASTLSGARFRLADLRGRPALLVLVADACGDPACNVLGALERAYRRTAGRTRVIWVDVEGTPDDARKIARVNHLTFPVVIDRTGASIKAWQIQGYPYWLALDASGRVVRASFKPPSPAELERLLNRS